MLQKRAAPSRLLLKYSHALEISWDILLFSSIPATATVCKQQESMQGILVLAARRAITAEIRLVCRLWRLSDGKLIQTEKCTGFPEPLAGNHCQVST